MEAGLSEIARFLALRPPFDALAPEELGELVVETQIEFYAGGEAILTEDGGPVTFLRVIHCGAVDIVHEGRSRPARSRATRSGTPRCCPDCRPDSRRARPRTRSATGSRRRSRGRCSSARAARELRSASTSPPTSRLPS